MVAARILSIFLSFYLLGQLAGPSNKEWKDTYAPVVQSADARGVMLKAR